MLFNFYVFDRTGQCLYYEEWVRKYRGSRTPHEDQKLMYGMIYSMKQFAEKISPRQPCDGFNCFKTNRYRLHIFETATGLRFVLNSDSNTSDLREVLKHIYSNIYLEYVVKDPMRKPGEAIRSGELFAVNLNKYVKGLNCFAS